MEMRQLISLARDYAKKLPMQTTIDDQGTMSELRSLFGVATEAPLELRKLLKLRSGSTVADAAELLYAEMRLQLDRPALGPMRSPIIRAEGLSDLDILQAIAAGYYAGIFYKRVEARGGISVLEFLESLFHERSIAAQSIAMNIGIVNTPATISECARTLYARLSQVEVKARQAAELETIEAAE